MEEISKTPMLAANFYKVKKKVITILHIFAVFQKVYPYLSVM